ncbi:hypothetical protein D3C76_1004800 [compost metagenome]
MAFHHNHVEPVVLIGQDLRILPVEQVIEHPRAAARDLGEAGVAGETLLRVQLAEAADAGGGVRQAGAGEAPGADGGADQRALARRTGQPFAEQRQVQALDAERLRPAGRTGQDADIGGQQPLFADAPQGAGAGLEGEGGELDLDGGHADLASAGPRL